MEFQSFQLISCHSGNAIALDEEALQALLTKDEIKDRYVSVISITGTFRQGKSFLLNFLLRYLQVKYLEARDVTDWLKPEDGPLKGFSYVPGSKRHTTGIQIWSEIFLGKVPSGEEVAIILLDTQGSFDNQSTMNDCAKIFALSTLISSVQIYNVMRGIKQYDLTHLKCFGDYGTLLSNCGSTPFQNLCFLVRDWACPYEHPYGEIGGAALLEETFESDSVEIKEQIDNIKGLFDKVNCFLLPHPGRDVDVSDSFNGDLNKIDEIFKDQVQSFVPTLLSPENLVLKSINGKKIKAEELIFYLQEYCNVLKEGDLPKVETIFKATVVAHFKAASFKALKLYKKNMDLDVKHNNPRGYKPDVLYNMHTMHTVKCIDYYDQMKKFDDESIYDEYLVGLKDNMSVEFKRYRIINEDNVRRHMQQQKKMEERAQFTRNETPGTSGLGTLGNAEKAGIAAGVIGGAAVLAFGISKLFTSSRGNND